MMSRGLYYCFVVCGQFLFLSLLAGSLRRRLVCSSNLRQLWMLLMSVGVREIKYGPWRLVVVYVVPREKRS